MTDTTEVDREETAALSIRLPASLLDRVKDAGKRQGCKNQTQSAVLVLTEGLEAIDRQKSKPHRLERVTGRIEWIVATILALLWIGFPNISAERVAEKRKEIFKQLEKL